MAGKCAPICTNSVPIAPQPTAARDDEPMWGAVEPSRAGPRAAARLDEQRDADRRCGAARGCGNADDEHPPPSGRHTAEADERDETEAERHSRLHALEQDPEPERLGEPDAARGERDSDRAAGEADVP